MARFILISAILLSFAASQPASATTSCGFAPQSTISIPDGQTTSKENIQIAIADVKNFAEKMNTYLTCLEMEREQVFLVMNKDHQKRWVEDYDNNVNVLANLQEKLNEQIRAFNAATQ